MQTAQKTIIILIFLALNLQCSNPKPIAFKSKKVYQTESLVITQISPYTYIHTSFKQTDDFGYVPCNGQIVIADNEAVILDTPTNNKNAEELINWVTQKRDCTIKAVIPTHFHDDCLGGLEAFTKKSIPSYGNYKTIALAKQNNLTVPQSSFTDSLIVNAGTQKIEVKFFGEGHTKDNVIAYLPSENIMFGGCLIKELGAGKGYTGDANLTEWSSTVQKIKRAYPDVKMIIPGHGKWGNSTLLDYTITLFKTTH
ncbi:subclass B1 metallo-beta-lactamase [Flavobacterium sedimenticola]|uniref:Beta-lactamase n=1 Tax=Flavobacterium sedimenticola TaxID=3043286 RepID=A0ABT6XP35_9FLAO|nr:subclass B1 metallo-beta-lactamase [Flavobacterium sedimenticola]MDI9256855.1 subclass B1 metallo-beta-lactamase [Flavobacterium sedimenticola]